MEDVPEVASHLPDFPIERVGASYQVGLLWRSEQRPPDNYAQAMATAKSLLKKLELNGKRKLYDDVLISEYLSLDAIEREPHPELPGYYMPHHAVFRADATTTKTRVVFNASASMSPGKALNDMVDPGPSLLPDLAGMLLRWREYQCAVQADIRKAFFMIGMRPEDRPFLRFLWPDQDSGEMCVWRLKKLPFGVNCSPFVLTAVLHYHLDRALEVASADECAFIELLLRSFYVDDCLVSVLSSADAEKLQELSINLLQGAGMELRKWRGNTIPCDGDASSKALGVEWCTKEDVLAVAAIGDVKSKGTWCWTRRSLLKCVASVFDPLGFASAAVLPGKMLLQECWKLGGDWDDPLPVDLVSRCEQWWGALGEISSLKIPRWIGCSDDSVVSLHLFADASEKGYGCCIYAVHGDVSSLLFAKAKVTPVSPPTLARLELQAVFQGSKVLQFVHSQLRLRVVRIVGWTDSLTTWHWINNPSYRWKTYVANRVASVQEVSKKLNVEWRHCPGSDNPADLASRGVSPNSLSSSLWFSGPEWIVREEDWPQEHASGATEESSQEVRVAAVQVTSDPLHFPWDKFSRWQRARSLVVRMLLWKYRKSRAELYPAAEAVMYRAVQADCFAEEISLLKNGQSLPRSSKLVKLSPFLDEFGVLRVGGRLQESNLSYQSKHPVILGKHHLTELLLEKIHAERLHQGVESVLAHIQKEFWIVSVRRLLRNLTERCIVCRWFRAEAGSAECPPLPADRVVHEKPFGLTGVDYAGPLFVCSGIRGEVQKCWVVLFVCGTTRAVHLDVVGSLSTESFMLAFHRFVARRGKPLKIRSDNATTFKAAAQKVDIVWLFNPPAAPWHGGFFERLVGSVKVPLRKVLGKAQLSQDELATVLIEIESVVNSRPLTLVSTDVRDEQALTPAMMMGDVFASEVNEQEKALTAGQMSARLKYIQRVKNHLEKRWRDEYLVKLHGYQKSKSVDISPGEVVLVMDEKKRHLWRMGRVVEMYPGRDGKCRVAKVRVGTNTMLRAIQRLVPLEVSGSCSDDSASSSSSTPAIGSVPAESATGSSSGVSLSQPQVVVSRRSGRVVRPRDVLDL